MQNLKWVATPGSRRWPLTVEEERRFAAAAAASGPSPPPPQLRRPTVSVTMVALRSGADFATVAQVWAGLCDAWVAWAYDTVAVQLAAAREAWAQVAADPAAPPAAHRTAARLLPVPVHRIGQAAPSVRLRVAAREADAVAQTTADVAWVERTAAAEQDPAALFAALQGGSHGGRYADPRYLPDRCATLTPARLARLTTDLA